MCAPGPWGRNTSLSTRWPSSSKFFFIVFVAVTEIKYIYLSLPLLYADLELNNFFLSCNFSQINEQGGRLENNGFSQITVIPKVPRGGGGERSLEKIPK